MQPLKGDGHKPVQMQSVQTNNNQTTHSTMKLKPWDKLNPVRISEVPRELQTLVQTLCTRDSLNVSDCWHQYIVPALDQLDEDLEDGNMPADYDSDFMSDHFGLEPDMFIALLSYVA